MRAHHLVLAAVVLGAPLAHAERATHHAVWAARELHLRERPGEDAEVVGVADAGDELTVIGRHGRWLHVRHDRRVGWVTRTEVTQHADVRPRPARSGFSGKPIADATKMTVTIGKVRGFDDPQTKATATLDLRRGDVVTVLGRGERDWLLVESDAGDVGWIPAVTVRDGGQVGGRFTDDPRAPHPPASRDDGPPDAAAGSTDARVDSVLTATAGAQTFAMRQTGGADGRATETGEAAAIGAAAHARVTGGLWAGAGVDAELGTGALIYQTAAETSAPMSARSTVVDARAELAWGARWRIAARGGYHYGSLAITSDRSEPMLVGERTGGVTAGLGVAAPIGGRAALTAAIDVMPAGAQAPRELPPGILYATQVRAAWAHATVSIRLPAHVIAAVSYRGGVTTLALTDGQATPVTATRTDQIHTITAGIGLAW